MTRTDVINAFISTRGFKSYLEIGIRMTSLNFDHIECQRKIGVDPFPDDPCGIEYLCTSDVFFSQNMEKFDIVFIDGLHEEEQVDRDIANGLSSLNSDGVVVIHDALPPSEWHQRPKTEFHSGEIWNGTVWKSVLKEFSVSSFCCFIVDTDCGCAVIDTSRPSCHRELTIPDILCFDKDFNRLCPYIISTEVFSEFVMT